MNLELAKRIISLCDLTSLNDDDTDEKISKLCEKAVTPHAKVAAVCIYPRFISLAKKKLNGTGIKIATVCNFPGGDNEPSVTYAEIKQAIKDGADEIDLVIPYKKYIQGDRHSTIELIRASKEICGKQILLKTILETGKLESPENIFSASIDAVFSGADILKTSTGKITVNATPQAAKIMILVIRSAKEYSGKNVGFKAAGGIKTVAEANTYLEIAENIMGKNWITPQTFRFGASSLLDNVLREVD